MLVSSVSFWRINFWICWAALIKKHNVDEISLKDKLTNSAHQTTIVEYAGFTTTSVALKVCPSLLTNRSQTASLTYKYIAHWSFINFLVSIANHGSKCVMAETCLLFELLKTNTGMIREVNLCSMIRKTAFGFMAYKGPRCVEAAATMMVQALAMPDYC